MPFIKYVINKAKLIYDILSNTKLIVIYGKGDTLKVMTQKYSKQDIKKTATMFFQTAYNLR